MRMKMKRMIGQVSGSGDENLFWYGLPRMKHLESCGFLVLFAVACWTHPSEATSKSHPVCWAFPCII